LNETKMYLTFDALPTVAITTTTTTTREIKARRTIKTIKSVAVATTN